MIPDELIGSMRDWRHYLHQHPEFGFEEANTAEFVVEKLREFGIEDIQTGIGGTGVVATVTRGTGDRVVALRADMDCLRIHETTNLPYASLTPGLMHACGHDGHTTILLGVAAMLARDSGFDGTVRLVFQPAEEWGQGMKAMMRDGLGTQIPFDEIYGLHNFPGLPIGSFEICPGPFMGAEDGFKISIQGSGGHASRPHDCHDAIVCACSIVSELQTIVSRTVNPADLAVVSVTAIHGDNVKNAIAGQATIEGDCRHFDDNVSKLIEATMNRIVQGVAATHGCEATLDYERVFIPLVNEANSTHYAIDAANQVFGAENVNGHCAPIGASEDFAQILSIAPGAYGFIGNGDSAPLHNAQYNFNDEALKPGVEWFLQLVKSRLPV